MLTGISLLPLRRADGSATYSVCGFSVLAAINGPTEVQRRDELPEEATVDVVVRPAVGVGGVRECHLESIIHKTLRRVILVSAHPRKLIQVTLQVTRTPENDSVPTKLPQATTHLPILPALLQASMLALLSTSIPLADVYTSTLIAVDSKGSLLRRPSAKDVAAAHSLHVFAVSAHNRLLVAESEGSFDIDFWEAVVEEARRECRGKMSAEMDMNGGARMDTTEGSNLEGSLRGILEAKIAADKRWKEGNK
ncbi:exosome non-catalytic core subunit rrp46 [Trapelia coarctata]|nr:exosome non-catalytic core subunit rrp46 [Trapelia coarctata]